MARLTILPVGGDDGAAVSDGNRVNLDVFGILAHRSEAANAIGDAIDVLWATGTLSERLKELLRIRIAFHNQCRSCMAIRFTAGIDDGVTDDLVCSLEKPEEASDLTDAERAALRFADLFATNHLSIDDDMYDELRRYFNEGEIVELGLHCALKVGMGRLAASWNVTDHVPDEFKVDGVVTPWGASQLIARSRLTELPGVGNGDDMAEASS